MSVSKKTLTPEQAVIQQKYVDVYGLQPSQITFDGDKPDPILDHNAISILSLKLTSVASIGIDKVVRDDKWVTVHGLVTLADGRSRGSVGSCKLGSTIASGKRVDSDEVALGVATSRMYRQAMRNVGIDIHKAHLEYLATGKIAGGNLEHDPRSTKYAELHILAAEAGLIVGRDDSQYRNLIAATYGGVTSAKELDDLDLHTFTEMVRVIRNSNQRKAA
ncbi:MAG: hypothetical protein IPM50_02780 [Acidobacteriota bacterium]|nr:MAG: hypothetical protein IPM50_02780 [Acidobacteriota bacterium]